MKRFTFLAIAAAALCGALALAQSDGQASAKPISKLEWLVGGVWTADASAMGNGMQRIETRYQWSDNNAYIRFTTHFVTEKASLRTYDGNFFWNPSRATLAVWYMDARNEIIEAPVTVNADLMEMKFNGTDFEGKSADLRVQVNRKNNDLYRWTLAERQGDGWKDLAALDYARR